MSTYPLSQTAAEIDSAINKVHNADTAPTQGSTSMVTSGGVYTAVNNINVSALPITTEAQGITNYDNDNNVPTNAAVKDYVDTKTGGVATYTAPDFYDLRGDVATLSLSETSDPENIGALSGGVITISAGLYHLDLSLNAGNRYRDYDMRYNLNVSGASRSYIVGLVAITDQDYQAPYPQKLGRHTFYVPDSTTLSISVKKEISVARHYMNNFALTLVKVS